MVSGTPDKETVREMALHDRLQGAVRVQIYVSDLPLNHAFSQKPLEVNAVGLGTWI